MLRSHLVLISHATALPTFVKTPTSSVEVSLTDRQVLLKCLATGHPTPTITWWKDGEPLQQDHWHVVSKEGTLKIIDPKIDDEGNYECVAQNSAGEIVSKAVLDYYGVEGKECFSPLDRLSENHCTY